MKNRKTIKLLIASLAGALVLLNFYFYQSNKGNTTTLIMLEKSELLLQPYHSNQAGNKVLTIIKKGEVYNVDDIEYYKDAMYFKIKLQNGTIGYVEYTDGITEYHIIGN